MEYINEETGDFDLVGALIDYENGALDEVGTFNLFSHLIHTGMVWDMQGHYGRKAAQYIALGYIDIDGTVYWEPVDDARRGVRP